MIVHSLCICTTRFIWTLFWCYLWHNLHPLYLRMHCRFSYSSYSLLLSCLNSVTESVHWQCEEPLALKEVANGHRHQTNLCTSLFLAAVALVGCGAGVGWFITDISILRFTSNSNVPGVTMKRSISWVQIINREVQWFSSNVLTTEERGKGKRKDILNIASARSCDSSWSGCTSIDLRCTAIHTVQLFDEFLI